MQMVIDVDHPNGYPSDDPRHIHLSCLQLPATYDAVLDYVAGLHARPPIIPPTNPPTTVMVPPPEHGYDLIFHIGLAGRGPFRLERLAHKTGYRLKDSFNQYAPIVDFLPEPNTAEPSQVEILDQMRVSSASMAIVGPQSPIDTTIDQPIRGFGKGYESFGEDLHTTIDVEHLVVGMKEQGVDVGTFSSPLSSFFLLSDVATGVFIDGCRSLCERLHILLLSRRGASCVITSRQGFANQSPFYALLSRWPAVEHGRSH
jgi:hypothetical protein